MLLNIFFDGKKVMLVPVKYLLSILSDDDNLLSSLITYPSLNSIWYKLPSLFISSLRVSDKALTTETPTP